MQKKEFPMKVRTLVLLVAMLCSTALAGGQATPPASPTPEEIGKRVETYLRNLYAWGPDFTVTIGNIRTGPADLYVVPVTVTAADQTDSAIVLVSRDGRYMFRGEIQDLTGDPLAVMKRELQLDGYPSKGSPDARIVIVEFADFQCPSCRQLSLILREVAEKYPSDVRIVFKHFPLEQIHPWAMTAALAGHCALQKSPETFWKFHDAVFDGQDLISPSNAYDKLTDLAVAAGAERGVFQQCMAGPDSKAAVERSLEEGRRLQIRNTPTSFVNGRELLGPDPDLLQQYIEYDLQRPSDVQRPSTPSR
jgi:protein-disulfide isomerase